MNDPLSSLLFTLYNMKLNIVKNNIDYYWILLRCYLLLLIKIIKTCIFGHFKNTLDFTIFLQCDKYMSSNILYKNNFRLIILYTRKSVFRQYNVDINV